MIRHKRIVPMTSPNGGHLRILMTQIKDFIHILVRLSDCDACDYLWLHVDWLRNGGNRYLLQQPPALLSVSFDHSRLTSIFGNKHFVFGISFMLNSLVKDSIGLNPGACTKIVRLGTDIGCFPIYFVWGPLHAPYMHLLNTKSNLKGLFHIRAQNTFCLPCTRPYLNLLRMI